MADVFCVIECWDQCPLVGRFIPEICFMAKTIKDSTNTDQIFWRVKSFVLSYYHVYYELNWIKWTYCFAFVEFVQYSRFLFLAQIESYSHICSHLHNKFQNNLQEYRDLFKVTSYQLFFIKYDLGGWWNLLSSFLIQNCWA